MLALCEQHGITVRLCRRLESRACLLPGGVILCRSEEEPQALAHLLYFALCRREGREGCREIADRFAATLCAPV